jgi:hypothetical protein
MMHSTTVTMLLVLCTWSDCGRQSAAIHVICINWHTNLCCCCKAALLKQRIMHVLFAGARVALVELPFAFLASAEKGGVGGTCVLRGCVPKKLLLFATEFKTEIESSKGFG